MWMVYRALYLQCILPPVVFNVTDHDSMSGSLNLLGPSAMLTFTAFWLLCLQSSTLARQERLTILGIFCGACFLFLPIYTLPVQFAKLFVYVFWAIQVDRIARATEVEASLATRPPRSSVGEQHDQKR